MKFYKEDNLKPVYNKDPTIRRLWRGKIFQGCLNKGSEVKIAPIMSNYESIAVKVKVKGIYNVNFIPIENAKTGDIVYIDITQKKDLHITESSCVYDIDLPFIQGNVLQYEIDQEKFESLSDKEKKRLSNLSIMGELTVTWFGTPLFCKIIGKSLNEDRLLLTMFPMHKLSVSLPIDIYGEFLYKKFLLELDNTSYIIFTLNRLTTYENVIITIVINNTSIVSKVKLFFNGYNFEIEGNKFKFHNNYLPKLIGDIINMTDTFGSEEYQIFTNLNLNPTVYREQATQT